MISDIIQQLWINFRTLHTLHKLIDILPTDVALLLHVQYTTQEIRIVLLFLVEYFFIWEEILDDGNELKLEQRACIAKLFTQHIAVLLQQFLHLCAALAHYFAELVAIEGCLMIFSEYLEEEILCVVDGDVFEPECYLALWFLGTDVCWYVLGECLIDGHLV